MLTLKWTVKIISDNTGNLINKPVAGCVNKLAQFQFRMTVLKGKPFSPLSLSPPTPFSFFLHKVWHRIHEKYLMTLVWRAKIEFQNLSINFRDFVQKRNRLKWPIMTDSVREKGGNAIPITQRNNIKWQDLMSKVYVQIERVEAFV